VLWFIAGLVNLAAGAAIAWLRWPAWRAEVPVDWLFLSVPIVAAGNVLASLAWRRAWWLLPVNMLCGPVMGLFAAFQFESFGAGLLAVMLGSVPSAAAIFERAQAHPSP
jgi:hypothetical protein